jgi:hypothetical protein
LVAPKETPETTPAVFTVAIPVAAELHTPPLTVLLSTANAPWQTVALPVIVPASGNEFTETTLVAFDVPQLPVTV